MTTVFEAVTTPISDTCPCGKSVTYDPAFAALKSEMNQLGGIDADRVVSLATDILTSQSKDLRVLAYLAWALLRAERWLDLADLFTGAVELFERFPETLFPERPRARVQAVRYLSEQRFTDTLSAVTPVETDRAHVTRIIEALRGLAPLLEKHLPEAPFPSTLLTQAETWDKALAASSAPAPARPDTHGSVAPALPPKQTPATALATARSAASYLSTDQPDNPLGYRLMRVARWDPLRAAPAAVDGRIRLEGPTQEQREACARMAEAGDYRNALAQYEQLFSGKANHLWLDLQKYAADAARAGGESYAMVADAIESETAALLGRVPELLELCFSDGTPLASAETRTWLENLSTGCAESTHADEMPSSGKDRDCRSEEQAVSELIASGRTTEALNLLRRAVHSSADEQENFRRKVLMGRVLLKAGKPEVAAAVLESLSAAIDRHSLERWAPQLAADALAELHHAYVAVQKRTPSGAAQRVTDKRLAALAAVSRIDPARACALHV